MHFLVLYGTTEGQTRKIAESVSDRIQVHGHQVTLVDVMNPATPDLRLQGYDGAIIAASVHVGRYQSAVEEFVRSRHQTLNRMRTAFLSVSLAAASSDPDDINGIEECVHRFTDDTHWKPGEVHHVKGAFRFTQYDFFKRWGMKFVAYQNGISTNTSRDLELTDWISLAVVTDALVSAVARVRNPAATGISLRTVYQG